MARVVLATLRGAGGFEKRLVVKQIRDELACDEEFVRRFVEEAKTTVSLAHPNIVPVYELGVELGTYFLVMELVEGVSLAELLRATAPGQGRHAALSPEEGAYVGVEVCRALDYAHRRRNVVHRDVTPRNVMTDEEGQIKVIDFGIAAPVATGPSGHGVFGSPGHMPPEQMEGRELTPAADVFAVAVLVMELWRGEPPFRRKTPEEVVLAMRSPHPKPSDADIRLLPLDDVFRCAMSLDACARPQQADDLARHLRRFLAGIDLGDVARQLGDRVRSVRRASSPPPALRDPPLQRPVSRPTATQIGTKTFALREDVRTLGSAANEIESSTRRLVSEAPHANEPTAAANDAHRPAPISSERGTRRPLTIARVASLMAVAAAMMAGSAFGAFLWGRSTPGAGWAAHASSATRPPPAEAPAPTVEVPSTPSAATLPRPSSLAAIGPLTAATAAGSRDPSVPERAQLVLLGDGTLARIDGIARGSCPMRVAVEPGRHAVTFLFPPTGESKSERISVAPGERLSLRADFTGAAPTVRVARDP